MEQGVNRSTGFMRSDLTLSGPGALGAGEVHLDVTIVCTTRNIRDRVPASAVPPPHPRSPQHLDPALEADRVDWSNGPLGSFSPPPSTVPIEVCTRSSMEDWLDAAAAVSPAPTAPATPSPAVISNLDNRPSHQTPPASARPWSYPAMLIHPSEEEPLAEELTEEGVAAAALLNKGGPVPRSTLGMLPLPPSLAEEDYSLRKFLWRIGARKVQKYSNAEVTVKPFVVSSGGSLDNGAAELLRQWRGKMTGFGYKKMIESISVGLARARAENFIG